MAASYPTSVKTFTTKNNGDTIQPAHVNDLQDEVVAVEQGLLNGFQHTLKPLTTATYDLGSSALRWRDLHLSRDADIDGILDVAGAATFHALTLIQNTGVTQFRVYNTDTAAQNTIRLDSDRTISGMTEVGRILLDHTGTAKVGEISWSLDASASQNTRINIAVKNAGVAKSFTLKGDTQVAEWDGALAILDGQTAPAAVTGKAVIYVDSADGDLKVKFADGVVKTLATDT